MDISLYTVAIAAFLFACVGIYLLRPLAIHWDIVDSPGGRKCHEGDIPLVGGLAIFLAVVVNLLWLPLPDWPVVGFVAASAVLLVVGLLDDAHEHTSPRLRFVVQCLAALIMIYGGDVVLQDLGRILDGVAPVGLGLLAVPFTVFAAVGFVNALNMIDGVDGLAGSVALTAAAGMIFFALRAGDLQSAVVLLLLAAAILGFLLFNWRFSHTGSAKVFLGDAGTMFVGGALCWFSIQLSQGEGRAMTPVTALWLFAVPLIDTVSMMLRRVLKGRSPFAADREHFHHLLLLAGFKERETVLLILLLSVGCAGVGILGDHYGLSEAVLFYLFLGFALVHLFLLRHAWRFMRLLKRGALLVRG
jgi:UDP-GlcNAc:undecaprenyl-phosphate/decaprenyl-phosphate GlcNAc-1-phosphate transferase